MKVDTRISVPTLTTGKPCPTCQGQGRVPESTPPTLVVRGVEYTPVGVTKRCPDCWGTARELTDGARELIRFLGDTYAIWPP